MCCGWAAGAGASRMSPNLDSVPAAGATLVVGLAKVKGATGGPARLFALSVRCTEKNEKPRVVIDTGAPVRTVN